MNYISDGILSKIKHEGDTSSIINEKALRQSLWYSSTKGCYAQYDDLFKESPLSSPRSDDFVLLALKAIFQLELIKIYGTQSECHHEIDALSKSYMDTSLLFVFKKERTSVFTAYIEGLRNSLAHGSFNKCQERTFFISQQYSKPNAEVKFFLQSKVDCSLAIMTLADLFYRMVNGDVIAAKYDCIRRGLSLEQKNNYLYSAEYGCYVIIDDDFKFKSDRHVAELGDFIRRQTFDVKTVILVDENLGNIKLKNRTSTDGNIVVIQQNKLIEYFDISL